MIHWAELGGDVGELNCILASGRLKHLEQSGFIARLGQQCQLEERSRNLPPSLICICLHPPQLSSATVSSSQSSMTAGMA